MFFDFNCGFSPDGPEPSGDILFFFLSKKKRYSVQLEIAPKKYYFYRKYSDATKLLGIKKLVYGC